MMRKVNCLMLSLLILSVVSVSAQVTIGDDTDAHSSAVLHLISKTSEQRGLLLPRVALGTEPTEFVLDLTPGNEAAEKEEAAGMLVFNTAKVLNGQGLYVWDGGKWMPLCNVGAPAGKTLPDVPLDESGYYRLSGKICYDVKQINEGDACLPLTSRKDDFANGFSFTYTFAGSASFSNLDYTVIDPAGIIADELKSGTEGEKLTLTFSNDVITKAKGLDKHNALKVTIAATFKDYNGADRMVTFEISIQDCVCGCAVRSTIQTPPYNGWLTFMCHNLGADETKDITAQMAYVPSPNTQSTTDSIVFGNLYQWGRVADGHQLRTSLNSTTDVVSGSNLDAVTGQVAVGATGYYGRFIRNSLQVPPYDWRIPQKDDLWNSSTESSPVKTANDPCPAGWRIPTITEFQSIFNGTSDSSTPSTAGFYYSSSGNYVKWNSTGTPGWKIAPKNTPVDSDYTLFLPLAGFRGSDGKLYLATYFGAYWSSSVNGTSGLHLFFDGSSNVNPNTGSGRVCGISLRCVAEN